ncbi:MAG: nucleotidyltransferase family protein [Sporomusaceae bacterium]|nr:nucleotidyltransferase family protein [Sporomusaceae bacterium]
MKLDAIVLAGGQSGHDLYEITQTKERALLPIAGRPMVLWVIEALLASDLVKRIIVVGDIATLASCAFPAAVSIVSGGATLLESLQRGLAEVQAAQKVFIASADIPLLTGQTVRDFFAATLPGTADLYYPIVTKAIMDQTFRTTKRTYVKLKDGLFTGGNLFLANPAVLPQCIKQADYLFQHRKQPVALCRFLGFSFLLRFLAGQLSLSHIEERASALLGFQGAVINGPFPLVAMDIDKAADLETATAFLRRLPN